ncbi:Polyketide cyclase / dehydrase and lipid transport [Stieleria maiorica]|uniref:Polyketide cyclase / dehydrase and lipid transport n=1 Tax=Stieleria maiorica TaxID=2795974 RepID=A0A5B9MS10_9BACT|nr:SRPBCC family protein [Stieleria maiorica]QEG02715.1 Polyketide cyclase / dehydrase and lipid transport [Stieleria maiorica]
MSKQNLQVSVSIDRDPEDVIRFIADLRNRLKYLQSLKSVSNIRGEPGQVTKSWDWKWDLLGHEFTGTARTVHYAPGRRYSFATEGGIKSQFSYNAEPDGNGTRLTVDVEAEIPAELADQDGLEELLAGARERGHQSMEKLKSLLEQN